MYRTEGQRVFGNEQMHPLLRPGLVGHWVGGGSGLTAFDRSGRGNHGGLTGGPLWTLGAGGQRDALSFDGVDDVVVTNLINLGFSAGTISWWQKPMTAFNSGVTRGLWGQFGGGEFSAQVYLDNNWYVGWSGFGGDDRVVVAASAANYPQNIYSHYTFTWVDGGDSILSQNGLQFGTTSGTTVGVSTALWSFGGVLTSTIYFPGSIDDIRIYDRALSQAEIVLLASTN